MRKTIFTLLLAFFAIGLSYSQGAELLKSIGKKDLSKLEQLMNDQVDFCINDGQKRINKSDAIKNTAAFLQDISISSCRKVHNGTSKEKGTYYEVGKLKSNKGNYRVFIYYENDKIVEFRIDNY